MSRALLLGGLLLATLAPSVAAAQDYTPSLRPSTYVPLDPADPSVVTHTWTGSAIPGLGLPFPVVYYGAVFNQVNVSTFGYLSFSSRPGHDEAPGGRADPAVAANQFPLPSAVRPNGVIAAWWDDLVCPPGSIRSREAYIQGSRTFTIEWNGCHQASDVTATVQMQVRFTEESNIIRVFYGAVGVGNGFSATVGIENPVRWVENEDQTWTLVSPGGSVGVTPPLETPCVAPGCARASWPTGSMIKYGRPTAADLQAGPDAATGELGIQIASLSGVGTITVELDNSIENDGYTDAHGVTWDYYVSSDDVLDPAVDTLLPCGNATGIDIPGTTTSTQHATCTATLAPGLYRICALVDPPTATAPEGVVIEANESNNSYCSDEFVVGADVLGTIAIPPAGEAGASMDVPVRVENRGSDATGDFQAQIWLQDCSALDPTGNVLAWETTLSLAGGSSWEQVVSVPIRPDAQGTSICAILVVDPAGVVPELNEGNNSYSTCAPDDGSPKTCTALTRPNLLVNTLTTDLPIGCYFGEPVGLNAEICNDEPVEARSFGLAFYLDVNSVATINDTLILSIPGACSTSADCLDLGGGQPQCVQGTCHAPCLVDADCGAGGLECEPSYVVPGNTCQLVLPGETCKWVSTAANIPVFDTRENAEFEDGNIFFSAIIDPADKVGEVAEGNENKKTTPTSSHCWTRKPDFQPVEVRTLPEIASGEVIPVYRRVRNIGTLGSAFSYRYVLSSNATISVHDLALHIEGVGPVGDAVVEGRADAAGTDLVRLPAGMVPGTYYLGLIVDPDDQVLELLEDNNTVRSEPVEVVRSTLRIVTASLPQATVGATYTFQLQAVGAAEGVVWSVTDGALPPGLQLDAEGLLHGTVLEAGTYLFRATATAGDNAASALLALEAVPARGPLAITLATLPPAFLNVEYRVLLGASGGLPPYAWSCPGLPAWLNLLNGYLIGSPTTTANAVSFTCTLADANGSSVARGYSLAVLAPDTVRIRSTEVEGGDVGRELTSCVLAENGSGDYAWSMDAATAPAGVSFGERDGAGCFSGTPSVCGTYLVALTVTDEASGLSDSRRLPLTIYCDTLRLTTRSLPRATRDAEYEAQLAANSDGVVVFELASGTLPAGLSLAADGKISGKVAVDARSGAHDVAVRFHDENGGTGLGAVSIEVLPDSVPDVIITHTKTTTGCSTSGEGSAAGLVPFAALFALLGLRRRSAIGGAAKAAGLAALALLLPAAAVAQTTPAYATYHIPKTYEPLPDSSGILDPQNQNSAFIITLGGWTVPFFGENYGTFFAHENGLLLFGANNAATSVYKIPFTNSTSAKNFIAGWWDDHNMNDRPGDWRWMVRGPVGNREVVFQWRWVTSTASDTNDGGEHQVAIFEDGTIALRWGEIIDSGTYTTSHRAVMGLMDAVGSKRSVPFHECSVYTTTSAGSCGSDVWNSDLRNTEAIFTTLPNLQVRATSTDYEGLAGLEQTFTATVFNYGPHPATAPIRFYASADTTVSEDDVAIGVSAPTEIGPFAEQGVELTGTLPRDLAQGRYFLLAVADPDDELREFVETDNAGGAYEFHVVEAMPDLKVVRLAGPASGAPASAVTIDLEVRNLGNLDAVDVPFVVVLSENAAITASDPAIYEGTISVDWLTTAEGSFVATLPDSIAPGTYHLGVVLDPDGTVPELDKLNNVAGTERPFVVVVEGLVAMDGGTWSLQVGSEFCIPLVAAGGDGAYDWTVVEGQLPPGLAIEPEGEGTLLCGRPTAVGIFDFTLEVASAGRTARTQMSLEVSHDNLALGISGVDLPVASFQTPYEAGLTAFGGAVPYTWRLASGVLPVGLAFGEDGLLFGTPLEAGTFTFQAQVTDAVNRTAIQAVTLLVTPPARVTCSSRTLGTLALGETFSGRLLAAGGSSPNYEWATRSTRRYGDPGGLPIDEDDDVPGLQLSVTGDINGTPTQVGRYVWTVTVTVHGTVETDVCALTVDVVGGQGLTIVTTGLPGAVPDQEYRAQLQAIGGAGALTWKLAPGSYLPDGLSLDPEGVIYGTPTLAALGNEPSRTFGFLVEVRDGQNLRGEGAYSITLAPEAVGEATVVEITKDEGCQAAGGGFSLAALALVLVTLRRRR